MMLTSQVRRFTYTLSALALFWAGLQAAENPAENKLIVNNPDDRENSVPTGWWMYAHQTAADITNTTSTLNARPIDIFVEQFTPSYKFTVTYVSNAGPYYKASWWYYGLDAATLNSYLSSNSARLISLKAYDIGGGQIRFAAVMISNTGKDSKAWWWYYGLTSSAVATNLANNHARLIQLNSYVSGSSTLYAVVMISNTGNDQKGYWYYYDVSPSQINSFVNTNNARITDLDRISSDGNYNVIMESCAGGCPGWWWYFGETGANAIALANQNGARILDTNTYSGCGDVCFSVVLIDNSQPPLDSSNEITSHVGQLLRAGGITGVQGLYLKQVGGPVLANLEESFVYEPASSIKVLPHLYAMTRVQNGATTLASPVVHYTNGASSCPDPAVVNGTEPLQTALREMMWHSDNARTRETTDSFGDGNINSFGASIGMLNSRINHIIGCGGPIPDQLTLADAGMLYEGVANGSLLTAPNRTTFYSLMAGKGQFATEGYDWTHLWDTDIPNIISQAAPGASAAQRQAYQNEMNLAYKAGSYVLCDATCTNIAEYLSITGWVEVPFCSGGQTVFQDYVFGIFLDGAIDSSWFGGKNTVADQNFNAAKAQTLREQIVNGLLSCGLATMAGATPDLLVALSHTGNFVQGQHNATYQITVSNAANAAATSGTVTLTGVLPAGLTLQSMSGGGWTCPGTAANNCTRSDVLSGGSSYPAITVVVNVAANAPASVINQATVSGGNAANFTIADPTSIVARTMPGDFDNDGRPDIALQFPDGSIGVWDLGGSGRQLPITAFAFLVGASSGITLVNVADLNGDGVVDLVLRFSDGSMGVWYMGGPHGQTITGFAFIAGPISGWMPVGMADLNGDGYLDMIIQHTNGLIGVWFLGGPLGNQIQGFAPISGPIAGWKVVGLADLNKDGHPDLIIQNTDDSIGVWYMGGASGNQIQGFALIAGPSSWAVVGTIDMDGDGAPDLVIRNTDGTLGVWYLGGAQGNQINGFTPITTPGATTWRELTAH